MAGETGWLKLHRKFVDSAVFQHPGMWHLFCYCMARANVSDKSILIPGTTDPMNIKRGEFVTGRNSLHAALYPHPDKDAPVARTVWRWLEAIQALGCVKLVTVSNRCTLVSVCNYETYQSRETGQCPAGVPPVSKSCPAGVPPVSTVEELNNQRSIILSPGFSTDGCNDAIVEIHDAEFGETFRYETNDLRWRWLFIDRWNHLPGVAKHSRSDLLPVEVAMLHQRFQEHDWLWKDAFQFFPINFENIPLARFLKDNICQLIVAGDYKIPEFTKKRKGKRNDRKGADNTGSTFNPATAAADPRGW